jgi:hypothetical protein
MRSRRQMPTTASSGSCVRPAEGSHRHHDCVRLRRRDRGSSRPDWNWNLPLTIFAIAWPTVALVGSVVGAVVTHGTSRVALGATTLASAVILAATLLMLTAGVRVVNRVVDEAAHAVRRGDSRD